MPHCVLKIELMDIKHLAQIWAHNVFFFSSEVVGGRVQGLWLRCVWLLQ